MSLTKKVLSAVLLAACGFAAIEVTGQEPAKKESRGPLPAHYGKLGLSAETKDELYQIDDEYDEKIEGLIEQIKQLQAERDAKMMEKLTPAERTRLQELRDEAAAKRADAAKLRDAAKKGTPAPEAEEKK